MIALIVESLLPFVGKALALIRATLALIGMPIAFAGDSLALIGKPLALVGDTVSFVCVTLLLAYLVPRLLIRVRTVVGLTRRFRTNGRIPTIRGVVHRSSMRLASASSNPQPPRSAPGWIRTSGLLLRRESLYPAELPGLCDCSRQVNPNRAMIPPGLTG